MTRTHRPAATLLLTLGLALAGLTACAEEEPVPKFAEEPTAAATPVKKEETAKEFIRRWAREQNAMKSGDTAGYRQIAPYCEPCLASADLIDEIHQAGGFVETEGIEVRSIQLETSSRDAWTYIVRVEAAPTKYKERADGPLLTLPGGRSTYSVLLVKTRQDAWEFANFIKVS